MVTLDGYTVTHATVKAVCIVKDGSNDEVWLPRAVCDDGDVLDVGDYDISVQERVAVQEGLSF